MFSKNSALIFNSIEILFKSFEIIQIWWTERSKLETTTITNRLPPPLTQNVWFKQPSVFKHNHRLPAKGTPNEA